jgi:Family of unknown function (DUF6174)
MLCILATVGAASGCGGGQDVTPEAIDRARQLWTKAGIRDYDLEWTVAGAQSNHYYVTVRGGEVQKVESIVPDGRRIVLKSFDTRYFSVDGLFLTMADYVALLKNDRPTGDSNEARVVMRFKPDPKLGYPQWFRRDVMGSTQALAVDVVKLVPEPSKSK